MVQTDEASSKSTDPYSGTKLALCFLALSALLYYVMPNYFGYATPVVSLFLAAIGIVGLGVELNKNSTGKKLKLIDLGMGTGLTIILLILYSLFNVWLTPLDWSPNIIWMVNMLLFPILFFGFFGIISGTFSILYNLLAGSLFIRNGNISPAKIFAFIIQAVALIAGALQILQILKFIG